MSNAVKGLQCSLGREKCQRLHLYYPKLPSVVQREVDDMVEQHEDLEFGHTLQQLKSEAAGSPTKTNKRKSAEDDTDSSE